jgi:hypothetical protein
MAILSHKDKITTKEIKKNQENEKTEHDFYSDVVKKLMS